MQQSFVRLVFSVGCLFWLVVLCFPAKAQQNPQYSQYIFNGLLLNPAYAGSKNFLNANAMYRAQWSGLEGAPSTATVSLDGSGLNNRIGWGAYILQDNIGVQRQTAAYANGAVKIKTGETGVLSFGVAGGISNYAIVQGKLKTSSPNDPAFTGEYENTLKPDLKAGVYYHTLKFYTGLAVANLAQLNHNLTIKTRPHVYFTTGYVLNLSDYLKFKPSFLFKEDFKGPTNIDFNGFLLIDDKIWVGASYRRAIQFFENENGESGLEPAAAMAYLLEFYPTDKIRVGYAYDATKSGLNTFGSHELSLGYYFIKSPLVRTFNPRYF